ncbi:hypothetical protein IMCC1989_2445 [gamma proteobacterium IMCC1989]|nr:hypothetical protein IMCC1989_2445 [gamma proteobacterium IMCC1989]
MKENNSNFLKVYISSVITVLGIIGSGIYFLTDQLNFTIVKKDSYISPIDISKEYIHISKIPTLYIEKERINNEYIKKSEVSEKYIKREYVEKNYVLLERYNELREKSNKANRYINSIPKSFPERTRVLGPAGKWVDKNMGFSIEMKSFSSGNGRQRVKFLIETPESPKYLEEVSSGFGIRNWKFIKNNRTFEIQLRDFDPATFSIKEIK